MHTLVSLYRVELIFFLSEGLFIKEKKLLSIDRFFFILFTVKVFSKVNGPKSAIETI